MLTTESIAQALQDTSATNGWDAVFAMNLEQVNALFFQEFLEIGPTNTRAQTFLRCALSDDDSSMWILDAALGPPALSFQRDSSSATVEMELLKGALITLDLNTLAIVSASWVRPNESKLIGSLELAKVKGEVNELGAVVMDLGASAYTPTISGVDPQSVLNTRIGEAVRTFFRENAATYTLGIIANVDVGASLTPTSFSVTTQQHPTKPDSCVLVLIKTDGQEGTVAPLAAYPIPDNAKVALLIAERPLFGGLSDDLNKSFSPFGTRFSRHQENNGWSAVGSGGSMNLGAYGNQWDCNQWNEYFRAGQPAWSSDADGNVAPIQIQLDGFKVIASAGQLVAMWTQQHSQYVTGLSRTTYGGVDVCGPSKNPSTVQIDYTGTGGAPTVDPGSSIVSFAFSDPRVSLKVVKEPSGWDWFWGGARGFSDQMIAATKESLPSTLKSFTVVTIDAFRLKSLLFQSPHTVQLTAAALPRGVYLTGDAVMPITVMPTSTTLAPGATVQFSATAPGGSKIAWQSAPQGVGSIDRDTGLYKAPSTVSSAQVVVVTALDRANTAIHGSAMVLVAESPAAHGIAVRPAISLVTPGHTVLLSTADAAGKPLTVNWTLSSNTGSVRQGRKQGEYVYVAPAQVAGVTDITLTAANTANPAETGTATIRLTPTRSIPLQPAQASVKLGAEVSLAATVDDDEDTDELRWVVYPAGSGKVVVDRSDPTKAFYKAPAQTTGGNLVSVVAYLVDDETAASGATTITLTS